ncbi:MAG: hypothetical protein K0Q68_2592 [Moraxellaceae bacterium]|jgi:hypothetical protein|nr:hypothetical protein [Moraxellaceae bacterium]
MQPKEIIDRFKIAQNSLVIQQSDFSLAAIYEMVRKDSIDVRPHYQRRDRWSSDKQSALIESFLLNVPVPPVYLSEDDYGQYSVIDGKQRITAICDFLSGNLRLKNLKKFPELDGLHYQDLPPQLQNALTVRPYIRVTTLLKQSDDQLKYEVFLRLNTGGDTLKPQEIRNVAYSGQFNDLLFELSNNEFLRERLKITGEKSTAFRSMEDLEHVLRFFAIRSGWQDMRKPLGEEMDLFMAENRGADPAHFRGLFLRAITACERLWGEHAFHKPTPGGWREQLISPLYDAQMVAVSLIQDDEIDFLGANRAAIIQGTRDLFEYDDEFVKAVSQSTNNSASIRKRVSSVRDVLLAVLRA